MKSQRSAGLKALFKKFGNGRFIKLDGTGWHTHGMRAHFQSVAGRTAVAGASAVMAYSAYRGVDIFDALFLSVQLGAMGFIAHQMRLSDALLTTPYAAWKRYAQYAIDTEGRAFPPENETELLVATLAHRDAAAQRFLKTSAGALTLTAATSLPAFLFEHSRLPAPGAVMPLLALLPMILREAALVRRCNKLLHPDRIYRFAANPPAEPAQKRAEAPAGGYRGGPM